MKISCAEVFGERLRKLRAASGLSQQALSNELSISKAALCYYENGQRVPDIDVLTWIADYFNVSADYLLGRSDVASVDPSQKIQTACEVTGLSEKAVKNLIETRGSGQPADLLIESEYFKAIVCRLDEIENLAIRKKRCRHIFELMGNDDFYDTLYLNGYAYEEETDKDYIFSLIAKAFGEILDLEHGLFSDVYSDYSEDYQDNILLEEYKISKVVSALTDDIQQKADCASAIKQDNITVRKKLNKELGEQIDYVQSLETKLEECKVGEGNHKMIVKRLGKARMRIQALLTFIEKYDVNFKLKEQKGASDNGSNNP